MRKIKLLIGFMSIAILSLLAHNWTKPVAGHGAVIHSPAAPATCADIVSFEFEGRTIELDQCYTHTFTYGGTTKSIYIHYTLTNGQASDRLRAVDSNGDGSTDLPPADLVTQLAQWTEEAWRTYRDYGFNDPLGRSDMNINLFDDNPLGWCCTGDSYSYDAPHLMWSLSNVGDPKDGATVAFHEMWHASQYSWNANACFVNEGTASNMTDHVNLPVDIDAWNDYIGRVHGYLAYDTGHPLTTLCYSAALWWTYFAERVGSVTTEPRYGIDALQAFWRELNPFDSSVTALPAVDRVTRNLSGGTLQLTTLWSDFTVANYAKDITGSGVPAKYRYQDELQTGAPDYPNLTLEFDEALTSSASFIATGDIQPWSARYFQLRPDRSVPIINLEFRQDTSHNLTYTLLGVREENLVMEERYIGRDFVRTFANDSYDKLVVIVTAHAHSANFRYSINGTTPVLRIIDPIQSRAVEVGPAATPGTFILKVEVLSPLGGGSPVAGLDPMLWTITVGTQPVASERILATAYVHGQYWLVIRAPAQASDGLYPLNVTFSTLNDQENEAVQYRAATPSDSMIVIDHSFSMVGDPLDAAQEAANLYVDSFESGDGLGVIAYNHTTERIVRLDRWSTTLREAAHTAIGAITASGNTAIGGALLAGLDEFTSRGLATSQWAMVLLSDGLNTVDPPIEEFLTAYRERRDAGEQVPVVHTIALGSEANRAEMQRIALETRGNYLYVALPSSLLRSAAAPQSMEAFLELSEVYRVMAETVANEQQIYTAIGSAPYDTKDIHAVLIDGSAQEAVFVVKWAAGIFDSLAPTLLAPDGVQPQSCTLQTAGHCLWRIPNPKAGVWLVTVKPFSGSEFPVETYLVEAAVKSTLSTELFLGLSAEQRVVGRPLPILMTLADTNLIPGASVYADITSQSGVVSSSIVLYDDGLHSDGEENDGVYGTTFYNTHEPGSYTVKVIATGESTMSGAFRRQLRSSFDMAACQDNDQDSLCDWWENENGMNPTLNDAKEDWDGDNLDTLTEFRMGTNPRDPDTDSSGESDGSEVQFKQDPLWSGDDQVACPLDFQVTDVNARGDELSSSQAALLLFSVDASHDHYVAWRATIADNQLSVPKWNLLANAIAPVGIYTDTTVTLGVTYAYRLQAVDKTGHASCILGPRTLTLKGDAVPPEGFVRIEEGRQQVNHVNVTLTLSASPDTTEMRISNASQIAKVDWEPYQETKGWQLAGHMGYHYVYVQYRDGAGNLSEVYVDEIRLDDGTTYSLFLPIIQK